MAESYIQHTIGKRKSSVARLYLKEGKGDITINKTRGRFTEGEGNCCRFTGR